MDHYGITEEEVSRKRKGHQWDRDWQKPHDISFNRSTNGAIVIASIPSGRGNDLMMGCRCEIWLFPDGTYSADISGQWIFKLRGRVRTAPVEMPVDELAQLRQCPKCGSTMLEDCEDGKHCCTCGKIIYRGISV